jgi:hypothetical protein
MFTNHRRLIGPLFGAPLIPYGIPYELLNNVKST